MAEQLTYETVTTFVAVLPGDPVEKILAEKFRGNHTPDALAAARRISAKKRQVKVPRHLMRKLWKLTGGWQKDGPASGWGSHTPDSTWKAIKLGDLTAIFREEYYCVLLYRGVKVGMFSRYNADIGLLSVSAVKEAVAALGRPWQPEEQSS